ncbi:MAG TPA: 2-C-methyl-D-erythritol 4-phosphate cytidylyltransferase [Planctomycetaceae bacterium]|nr:2-C-methyl-D-erythritol 4-phosphate cytidylyltransferase [Planctomycetaceae bacterium]
MAKFAVILPAAGKSSRFGDKKKKIFLDLKGRAVWLRAAEHFFNRDDVSQTLIAIAPEDEEMFKERYAPNLAFSNIEIVLGGANRADSVRNALARVRADVEFVAVHDAARPLLVPDWIDAVFREAEKTGAAIPGVRVTSTLKRVGQGGQIVETVPRDELWEAQTPQVFRRDWLLEAYAQLDRLVPTDEAQMFEKLGRPVSVVEGSPLNIKITTQQDFRLAEAALDALPKPKGLRALHPFSDEDPRFL